MFIGKIAEPGGSLDAVKRGGADANNSWAAQVTLIVRCSVSKIKGKKGLLLFSLKLIRIFKIINLLKKTIQNEIFTGRSPDTQAKLR